MTEKIIKKEVLEDILSYILKDYFVNFEKELISIENFKLLKNMISSKDISLDLMYNEILESKRKNFKYKIDTELNICSISGLKSKHLNSAYHSRRVSFYSLFLAKQLGLGSKSLRELAIGSSIHDNGKIAIPDDILHKEGSFNSNELKIMKTHAVLGEYFNLFGRKLDFNIARLATEHQERADGSGYPFGIDYSSTTLNGLILQFADILDALLDKRVYKEAWDYNSIQKEFEKLVSRRVLFEPIGEFFLEYTLPIFKEMNFNSSNFNFLENIYNNKLNTYDDFSQEILGFFKGDKNSRFNGKVSKSLDLIIKNHKPKILYTKEDRFKMIGDYLKNTYDSLDDLKYRKALKRIIPHEYLNLGYIKDDIKVI